MSKKLYEYAVTLNNNKVDVYFCHEFQVSGDDVYFFIDGNATALVERFKSIRNLTIEDTLKFRDKLLKEIPMCN